MTAHPETVVFTVRVPVAVRWATGTLRSTTTRTVRIVEDATILGGCRAIDKAVVQCAGHALADGSPEVSPNPGLLGWPVGA